MIYCYSTAGNDTVANEKDRKTANSKPFHRRGDRTGPSIVSRESLVDIPITGSNLRETVINWSGQQPVQVKCQPKINLFLNWVFFFNIFIIFIFPWTYLGSKFPISGNFETTFLTRFP